MGSLTRSLMRTFFNLIHALCTFITLNLHLSLITVIHALLNIQVPISFVFITYPFMCADNNITLKDAV